MSTVRVVAKDAGVSIATVSRVLNQNSSVGEDVRRRVMESIRRCGYEANVGRRVSSYIGLVYVGRCSLGEPYDAALTEGMSVALGESEFDLAVLNLKRDKRSADTYSQFFRCKGVRGVLLRTTALGRDICKAIADEGFPSLVIADRFDSAHVNYLYCDSYASSVQGMEHLISLGHRRIALAISDTEDTDHLARLEAYKHAHAQAGWDLDPSLIFRIPPRRPDGAQLIRRVVTVPQPPTAIYITDPMVAIGAVNEARVLGVDVPRDLSVLAFDDTDVRHNTSPRMTAVCQDAKHLGYEAFSTLAGMITSEEEAKPIRKTLSTWLEINQSTAPPPVTPLQMLPNGTRVVRPSFPLPVD